MINLFRLCRKDEISFDIVAKNGNNVEAKNSSICSIRHCCFDMVAGVDVALVSDSQ